MISVIIPVYNVEKYIVDCLESVVNQTVPFEQIIIVNDGSMDGSLSVCEEYQKKYLNVKLISQANQGLGAARNKGMEAVQSEYVIFLDSDDYIAKNTVEILQKWLQKESVDILYYDSEIQNECLDKQFTNTYDRVGKIEEKTWEGKAYFFQHYPNKFTMSACMACFKFSFLKTHGICFPEIRAHEDEWFSYIAALEAERVRYIPERLYVRRYREGSIMTSTAGAKRVQAYVRVFGERWNYAAERENQWSKSEKEQLLIFMIGNYQYVRDIKNTIEVMDSVVREKILELQKKFCYCWSRLIPSQELSVAFYKIVLSFVSNLDKVEDSEISAFFKGKIPEYEKAYEKLLKERLIKLPLGKAKMRVGIYGTGFHTEQLLAWYQYLCGDINCKLFFIDSNKNTGTEEYKGCPIINVADAGAYVDCVIVSSCKYEMEMKETVKRLYGSDIAVYGFYDVEKEELFVDYQKQMIARKNRD